MTLPGPEPTRCPTCDDVVGIYEPSVIAFPDGRIVHASIAAVGPDLEPGAVVRHRDCQPTAAERSASHSVQVVERELSRPAHGARRLTGR